MEQPTPELPTDSLYGQASEETQKAGTRRILIALSIVATVLGLDRVTKVVAQNTLMMSPPLSYWGDIVRFEYAENTGAFLSLGAGLPDTVRFSLLGVGVAVVLLLILLYIFRTRTLGLGELVGLSLIAGGGIGNLIDRLSSGYVVDFVSMGLGGVRTGIFNIADVAISAGVILFVFARLRASRTVEVSAEGRKSTDVSAP